MIEIAVVETHNSHEVALKQWVSMTRLRYVVANGGPRRVRIEGIVASARGRTRTYGAHIAKVNQVARE